MNPLLKGFLREVMPWTWQVFFALAVFTAATLSFDASLGAHSLGTYLAYISILPMVLLFRIDTVLDRRAQQGWPHQEILRNANGRKAPLTEMIGSAILLGATLLLGMVPIVSGLYPMPSPSAGLYPVHVQFTKDDDGTELWLFDLGSTVPKTARLHLTLDWSEATVSPENAVMQSPDERQVRPIPG